jgi:homoserine dehydrogenase
MILTALRLGKPVITANKALISAHGEELFAAARQYGANLYYEASVAGGIPIIKALREGFVGNRICQIYGIVNGTCNYILSRMKLERAEFAPTLAAAQRMGYAEADPAMDVDGLDSMHKTGAWILGAAGADFRGGHSRHHGERHRVRRQTGLHHQTARRGQGGFSRRRFRQGTRESRGRQADPGFGLSGPGSQHACSGQCQ